MRKMNSQTTQARFPGSSFRNTTATYRQKLFLDQVRNPNLEDPLIPVSRSVDYTTHHSSELLRLYLYVATLIDMGCCDTNEVNFGGYTRLVWAARNGHEKVVKIQQRWKEVNSDKPDSIRRT